MRANDTHTRLAITVLAAIGSSLFAGLALLSTAKCLGRRRLLTALDGEADATATRDESDKGVPDAFVELNAAAEEAQRMERAKDGDAKEDAK